MNKTIDDLVWLLSISFDHKKYKPLQFSCKGFLFEF